MQYIRTRELDRGIVEMADTEGLVPPGHILRKIDGAVDFNYLYQLVEPLYSEEQGRPSVDPVVLFKMVLIQRLYGLPSLQRTAQDVSLNVTYRWFLRYTLQEETPHFSTASYNFRHRFTEETVDRVFTWTLGEVAQAGYLSSKAVFIDGTHIKANANTKKQVKAHIPEAVVTPGNVHDSVTFDEVYDRVTETFPQTETVVADSAYKTPHICKKVFEDGRMLSTTNKRPQTMKGGHE